MSATGDALKVIEDILESLAEFQLALENVKELLLLLHL